MNTRWGEMGLGVSSSQINKCYSTIGLGTKSPCVILSLAFLTRYKGKWEKKGLAPLKDAATLLESGSPQCQPCAARQGLLFLL